MKKIASALMLCAALSTQAYAHPGHASPHFSELLTVIVGMAVTALAMRGLSRLLARRRAQVR